MALADVQAYVRSWLEDELIKVGVYSNQPNPGAWGNQDRFFKGDFDRQTYMQCLPSHNTNPSHTELQNNPKVMERLESVPGRDAMYWTNLIPSVAPPWEWAGNCQITSLQTRQGHGWEVRCAFDYTGRDINPSGPRTWFMTVTFIGLSRGTWSPWAEFIERPGFEEPAPTLEGARSYLEAEGWESVILADRLMVRTNGEFAWITLANLIARVWPRQFPRALIRDLIQYLESLE